MPDWSLSTPIFTVSPETCACAALKPATSAQAAVKRVSFFIVFLPRVTVARRKVGSDAEIGFQFLHIGLERRIRDHIHHMAMLDDIVAVGERRGKMKILL